MRFPVEMPRDLPPGLQPSVPRRVDRSAYEPWRLHGASYISVIECLVACVMLAGAWNIHGIVAIILQQQDVIAFMLFLRQAFAALASTPQP